MYMEYIWKGVGATLWGKSRELAKVTEFDEVFPLTPIL